MNSIFESFDDLINHSKNYITQYVINPHLNITNGEILFEELTEWYEHYFSLVENYYEKSISCELTDNIQYKNILEIETKLEKLNILIGKYEQLLNLNQYEYQY